MVKLAQKWNLPKKWREQQTLKKCKQQFWKKPFQTNAQGSFGKTVENIKKHWDVKLDTGDERKKYCYLKQNITQWNSFQKKY